MRSVCKTCGTLDEDQHEHEWLGLPDGCVCDFRTWNYHSMMALPPACKQYKGNSETNCETCEHDEKCHITK